MDAISHILDEQPLYETICGFLYYVCCLCMNEFEIHMFRCAYDLVEVKMLTIGVIS